MAFGIQQVSYSTLCLWPSTHLVCLYRIASLHVAVSWFVATRGSLFFGYVPSTCRYGTQCSTAPLAKQTGITSYYEDDKSPKIGITKMAWTQFSGGGMRESNRLFIAFQCTPTVALLKRDIAEPWPTNLSEIWEDMRRLVCLLLQLFSTLMRIAHKLKRNARKFCVVIMRNYIAVTVLCSVCILLLIW